MKKIIPIIMLLSLSACQTVPTEQTENETNVPQNDQSVKQEKVKPKPVDSASEVSPVIVSLLAQSQIQLDSGNVNHAVAILDRAIRISPRYPESYYRLAIIRLQQGEQQQAKSLAQKSISLGATGRLKRDALQLINGLH
ncbi:hypothetical protein CW745_12000 [Psychromonas sp. psych-6C06]|uniref:tetratricopeptide repeat protein n=1 Tax=Psychromonas sp. psych-6C06 TaxID=2058089 RepID=UPI000C349DE0|nr:tetratricopeptide repeat protein [Psychromonas sp. psych-6C06]PKF61028.1 hypothetical protein CW745_12000 [Psychromonas sp. psych-6C06]